MFDFFEQQDRANRATRWMVCWFVIGVLATVLLVQAVLSQAVALAGIHLSSDEAWGMHLVAAAVVLGLIGIGSWWRMAQLAAGGTAVAEAFGGRRVHHGTRDADERRLLDVVEEMAIASGVPMPQVYLLDRENGINAFAAGLSTADAAVAVTAGCLRRLERNELQGVVAHEFAHILSGDMRLNLRLIGWLHGLLLLSLCGEFLVRHTPRSRGRDKGNQLAVVMLVLGLGLWVLGFCGHLFGQLIKAAVGRRREFHADAAAVQFTRDPSGLAGALGKIGDGYIGARLAHANRGEIGHLCFGMVGRGLDLFATHPPLAERIRRLAGATLPAPARALAPAPPAVGAGLVAALSPLLRHAGDDPVAARAAVLAAVCAAAADPAAVLAASGASLPLQRDAAVLLPELAAAGPTALLPLIDRALPELHELPARAHTALLPVLSAAGAAGGVRAAILARRVRSRLRPAPQLPPTAQLAAVLPAAAVVLSVLAHAGAAPQRSRDAAVTALGCTIDLLPADQCTPMRLDAALDALGRATPALKRRLVAAATAAALSDGCVNPPEAELLRALCDGFGVPMPPHDEGNTA